MNVRIGVTHTPKEVEIAIGEDTSPDDVRKSVDEALAAGEALWLTDRQGRQICVPTEKLAYIEIGTHETARRVGFGA